MPELPDVEGFRRFFAEHAAGEEIRRVDVQDPMLLRNTAPRALNGAVAGRRFGEPRRHGKWVFAPAGEVEVLVHFGMTGLFGWGADASDRHLHDRVTFVCDSGELRYRNMRKFGGIWVARNEAERESVTGPLGPDACDVDRERFEALLAARRGSIKAALMDQRLMAGVGNLLADEILWRARVHPRTPVAQLSRRRRDAIHHALEQTLRDSIPTGRIPRFPGWLTEVRDTRTPHCPRCGRRLHEAQVAGRTTKWCPRCQRGG